MRKAPVNTEIKMAALSIARKNSKSGLLSVACLARLAGPLNRRDWRGVVVSETGNLAKELHRAMEMTADIPDSAGNPKLQRLSSRGRIDALQAGVMSIAACYAAAGIPRRGVYHGLAG